MSAASAAAALQNLLANVRDKELVTTNLMLMVQWQIGRQATTLQTHDIDDPEFADDLQYLVSALAAKLDEIRQAIESDVQLHGPPPCELLLGNIT